MNEPETTIVGNIGGDPELRFTPNGVAVIKFSVAQTPRTKVGDEWKDSDPTWFNCTAWRELAENCAETLKSGMRVIVQGRFVLRKYETKDGTKGQSLDLDVQAIGPELRWARATVTKATKGGGKPASNGGGGDDPWASASKERPAAAASADTQRAAQGDDAPPW